MTDITEDRSIEKAILSAVYGSEDKLLNAAANILCQEWKPKKRPIKVYAAPHYAYGVKP